MAPRVQVIAHRGAHERTAENTPEAYREAIRLGSDYFETDLKGISRTAGSLRMEKATGNARFVEAG